MQKSTIPGCWASQLFLIFSQIPFLVVAVPCYSGVATTTNSDPELCGLTITISNSTASTLSASKPTDKTVNLSSVEVTTIISSPQAKNTKIPISTERNETSPLSNFNISTPPDNQTSILNVTHTNDTGVLNPPQPRAGNGLYAAWGISEFSIQCLPSQEIYEEFPSVPDIPGITPDFWPDWTRYDNPEDAITYIQWQQGMCEGCICDEDGLLQPPSEDHPNHSYCPDQDFVNLCISIYGCSCNIRVDTPPPEEKPIDLTVFDPDDLLNTISQEHIPQRWDTKQGMILRGAYNRWYQNQQDKQSQRKVKEALAAANGGYGFAGGTQQNDRYLVPGTKEPYYLEGPDKTSPFSDNWRGIGLSLLAGGGRGVGSRLRKRESREDGHIEDGTSGNRPHKKGKGEVEDEGGGSAGSLSP
ncbi:hypothetical protein TWF281_007953 [Arthrobotrys megalospora]